MKLSNKYNKVRVHYAQANGRTAKFLCSHPLNTQNQGEDEKSIYGKRFVENMYEFNVRSRGSDFMNSRTVQNTQSRHEYWPYIFQRYPLVK
jgi:hypothetical protein